MKRNLFVFTAFLGMLYIVLCSDIDGAAHHGHGNLTGSPTGAVGHCQTSSCHGGNNPLTIAQLQVLDTTTMLPVTTYNALQTYLVTLTGNDTGVTTNLPGFGFMVSAVLGNHTQAGTYTIPTALAGSIHTFGCGATTVVEHSAVLPQDVAGINKYSIQFYWTAPPPASDSVSFFSLLNAVNGDGGKTGDYPDAAPIVTIYENAATATCGIPDSIADSAITGTSAYVYWSAVVGAVGYNIQYRPVGTTTWSTATSATNYKTVTGLSPSTTYEYNVQTVCSGSPSLFSSTADTLTTDTATTSGIALTSVTVDAFSVYPNPAQGSPVVSYQLHTAQNVSIEVYDLSGKMVTKVAGEMQAAGAHHYSLAIQQPGVYYVRLMAGGSSHAISFVKK